MSQHRIYENLDCSNNFEQYFTTPEVMNSLKVSTFCHDLIGKVKRVHVTNMNQKIMNIEFEISNGETWAIAAWEENATRLEDTVLLNNVIAIDGLYLKTVRRDSNFACGRDKSFTIQNNSIVVNLTKMYFGNTNQQTLEGLNSLKMYTDIQECVTENSTNRQKIGLTLYVKSPFVQDNHGLRWGSLTDGKIKITTCIKIYNDPAKTFPVGQKLKVYGHMFDFKEKIAFQIESFHDIVEMDGDTYSIEKLRSVTKTPQKPEKKSGHSGPNAAAKKLKMQ